MSYKYNGQPAEEWLWGDLQHIRERLKAIKAGMRSQDETELQDGWVTPICPFCGKQPILSGIKSEQLEPSQYLRVCPDCQAALAYGYIKEVLGL